MPKINNPYRKAKFIRDVEFINKFYIDKCRRSAIIPMDDYHMMMEEQDPNEILVKYNTIFQKKLKNKI